MGCGKESSSGKGVDRSRGCVCEVVRAILDIQNKAVMDDCSNCSTNCFLEPMGGISRHGKQADTRVFTLLNKDGKPFLASFVDKECKEMGMDVVPCTSMFFRVEDIFDDCCATLRVLVPKDEGGEVVDLLNQEGTHFSHHKVCEVKRFKASESCVTVDLSCFCAVQCIADVDLKICK